MTSTFKVVTGGRFAFPSFPGLSGGFPTIFILYLNDLPSKHYHQNHQFHLCDDSINFLMS